MTLSGQAYICSAGDTFDGIALAIYGNEKYASDLYCANPELCKVMCFKGGEILRLPVVETESTDEESIMPAKAPWKE